MTTQQPNTITSRPANPNWNQAVKVTAKFDGLAHSVPVTTFITLYEVTGTPHANAVDTATISLRRGQSSAEHTFTVPSHPGQTKTYYCALFISLVSPLGHSGTTRNITVFWPTPTITLTADNYAPIVNVDARPNLTWTNPGALSTGELWYQVQIDAGATGNYIDLPGGRQQYYANSDSVFARTASATDRYRVQAYQNQRGGEPLGTSNAIEIRWYAPSVTLLAAPTPGPGGNYAHNQPVTLTAVPTDSPANSTAVVQAQSVSGWSILGAGTSSVIAQPRPGLTRNYRAAIYRGNTLVVASDPTTIRWAAAPLTTSVTLAAEDSNNRNAANRTLPAGERISLTATAANPPAGRLYYEFSWRENRQQSFQQPRRGTAPTFTPVGNANQRTDGATLQFQVQLFTTATGGSPIATAQLDIRWAAAAVPTPTLSLSASPASPAPGEEVDLTATATNAPGRLYDFAYATSARPNSWFVTSLKLAAPAGLTHTPPNLSSARANERPGGTTLHYRVRMYPNARDSHELEAFTDVTWRTSTAFLPPTVSIAASPNPAPAGQSVTLTAGVSNAPTGWRILFQYTDNLTAARPQWRTLGRRTTTLTHDAAGLTGRQRKFRVLLYASETSATALDEADITVTWRAAVTPTPQPQPGAVTASLSSDDGSSPQAGTSATLRATISGATARGYTFRNITSNAVVGVANQSSPTVETGSQSANTSITYQCAIAYRDDEGEDQEVTTNRLTITWQRQSVPRPPREGESTLELRLQPEIASSYNYFASRHYLQDRTFQRNRWDSEILSLRLPYDYVPPLVPGDLPYPDPFDDDPDERPDNNVPGGRQLLCLTANCRIRADIVDFDGEHTNYVNLSYTMSPLVTNWAKRGPRNPGPWRAGVRRRARNFQYRAALPDPPPIPADGSETTWTFTVTLTGERGPRLTKTATLTWFDPTRSPLRWLRQEPNKRITGGQTINWVIPGATGGTPPYTYEIVSNLGIPGTRARLTSGSAATDGSRFGTIAGTASTGKTGGYALFMRCTDSANTTIWQEFVVNLIRGPP